MTDRLLDARIKERLDVSIEKDRSKTAAYLAKREARASKPIELPRNSGEYISQTPIWGEPEWEFCSTWHPGGRRLWRHKSIKVGLVEYRDDAIVMSSRGTREPWPIRTVTKNWNGTLPGLVIATPYRLSLLFEAPPRAFRSLNTGPQLDLPRLWLAIHRSLRETAEAARFVVGDVPLPGRPEMLDLTYKQVLKKPDLLPEWLAAAEWATDESKMLLERRMKSNHNNPPRVYS